MATAVQLFQLERLDQQIRNLQQQVIEQRRRQERNPQVEAAEAHLEQLRSRHSALAAEQRRLEGDLADLEGKIGRDRTRLYGGEIVDSRELGSLERELAHYGAQRDPLEDRLLGIMDEVEQLDAAIVVASRAANEARQRWEGDLPELALQAEQMADVLAGLREERSQLTSSIDPRSLDLYERLRQSTGHAISTVSSGVCQWCRVGIPAKDIQHARAGQLVTCSNCARILHVAG